MAPCRPDPAGMRRAVHWAPSHAPPARLPAADSFPERSPADMWSSCSSIMPPHQLSYRRWNSLASRLGGGWVGGRGVSRARGTTDLDVCSGRCKGKHGTKVV